MKKSFDEVLAEEQTYDPQTREILKSFSFARKEIGDLQQMKQTAGWKLLNSKIRESLKDRIEVLVKDDAEVQTLLALLKVADTKSLSKLLDQEINKFLPDE